MSSSIDVCRRALSMVGTRNTIQSLEEKSVEARACKAWYDSTLKACLRSMDWGFARRNVALARITSGAINGWNFAYSVPQDSVKILLATPSLANYVPMVNNSLSKLQLPRVEYELGGTEATKVLYANFSPLYVYYTRKIDDVDMWDALFDAFMVTSLASAITIPITQKTSLAQLLANKAQDALMSAGAEDGNEENQNMMNYIPDSILSRM